MSLFYFTPFYSFSILAIIIIIIAIFYTPREKGGLGWLGGVFVIAILLIYLFLLTRERSEGSQWMRLRGGTMSVWELRVLDIKKTKDSFFSSLSAWVYLVWASCFAFLFPFLFWHVYSVRPSNLLSCPWSCLLCCFCSGMGREGYENFIAYMYTFLPSSSSSSHKYPARINRF